MVKRKGNLISSLCNISNILIADSNARKAKKRSKRFIEKHDQNIIDEDMAIAVSFYNLSYKTSPYVTYKIYEPKERLIYRLPYYPDRIAHHAIMNIVKDYWTKQFISNTYSCIAVRPYQDKLIQCEIDKAFTAGINYTDRKTCKAIYGEVCLPNTPVVTGYVGANQCGCPRVVTGTTPTA